MVIDSATTTIAIVMRHPGGGAEAKSNTAEKEYDSWLAEQFVHDSGKTAVAGRCNFRVESEETIVSARGRDTKRH